MGTWSVKRDDGRKYLVYDVRVMAPVLAYRSTRIPENDVAKLIMFLHGCGESWNLAERPEAANV